MSASNELTSAETAISDPSSQSITTETAEATKKPTSTQFPKIGKLSDFIYKYQKLVPETRIAHLAGSVKLHGAHADWVVSSDDNIRVQSRNMLDLSASNDNYGLFAFSSPLHAVILRLRDDILRRFTELNPSDTINLGHPMIISGEWCGRGIQKGVAISKLPKHFVIISIRINGDWVDEKAYADICNEAHEIFNIGKIPYYRLEFDMTNSKCSELTIQTLVKQVEQTCPFGLARGIKGRGEGIVWKAIGYEQDPEMWFKSKAESYAVSNSSKLSAAAVAPDNWEREDNFATAVVTQQRLQQGWEYLREMSVTRDRAATGKYVAWIINDILTEEEGEIATKQIGRVKLKASIKSIAVAWYKKRLAETEGEGGPEMAAIPEQMKGVKT
ncbi:MAG: hypothetical protein Q9216_001668 [Gyalolechia sp. 2 TL-2023]